MTDFQRYMDNPAEAFSSPQAVIDNNDLNKEEKLQILRQWRYDEYETEVADQENMAADKADQLGEINNLILQLENT